VMAESGDDSIASGLSTAAKERLRQSVHQAATRQQEESGGAKNQDADLSETLDLASLSALPDGATQGSPSPMGSPSLMGPHSTLDSRKLVSRFTLIRKLSQGGLGSIWLARDEKLKRTVAIKEMNVDASESTEAWQRFHREAEITGHLEHPNIVPLYQFGSDPKTGNPFYAMRFVGKHTLADAIVEHHERRLAGDDDALEPHRLLTAFVGICQAIAYAHSRGVIHRDLKPENVALDNFGQVIVLDWGLAKRTDDAEMTTQFTVDQCTNDSTLACTMDGDVIGTPLYMSPEQAAGDLNNVDEKTDIYGLGAILFSILTGCAPHENSNTSHGNTPQGGKLRIKELLKTIAEGETPIPRDFHKGVPADLESICIKAMSRKPYTRHASASVLADEVQRWMACQHEKRRQYNSMRIEGRELRANLQSLIRDFSTNVRFMASLPPIQEIIDTISDTISDTGRSDTGQDGINVWRERLATIFKGLLQANTNYTAIAFCHVGEQEFKEIVRVERHSTERATVRTVPLSRLTKAPVDPCVQTVMKQKPEEVFVALPANTESDGLTPNLQYQRQLSAGVPVFDERTEEPFGFVTIECDLQRILEEETKNRLRSAKQVLALDPNSSIWVHHSQPHGPIEESVGKKAEDLIPGMEELIQVVSRRAEFVDDINRDIYATRLDLAKGEPGLIFVFLRNPFQASSK
jgi:serine/threonine protein kinase